MTEKEISKLVHAELKRLSEAGRIIFQRNNAGHVPSAGVRVHLAPAGSADFIIFIHDGRTLHIELKSDKGRMNDNQHAHCAKLTSLGHIYWICNSLESVQRVLLEEGVDLSE